MTFVSSLQADNLTLIGLPLSPLVLISLVMFNCVCGSTGIGPAVSIRELFLNSYLILIEIPVQHVTFCIISVVL